MARLEGIDALTALSGTSADVSPLQVLFLVHRVRASGRLWMTRGVDMCAVDFFKGEIAGCTGFTTLVDGVDAERSWSLQEWADAVEAKGATAAESMPVVTKAICAACGSMGEGGEWMLNFVSSEEGILAPEVGGAPLSQLISEVIADGLTVDDVRSWFESAATGGLVAERPGDAAPEEWGLDPKCIHLLDAVEKDSSVGALFVEIGSDGWLSLGVLWKLGLVSVAVDKPSQPEKVTLEEPPMPEEAPKAEEAKAASDHERRRQRARPSRGTPDGAAASGAERTRRKRPKDQPKKKRRRDPRVVALKREPGQSPPDLVETHLKEAHDVLKSVRPEFIFRLKKTTDLERENIDKRHREACARYHPDRFRNSSQGVQSLAEGCFTKVSEAFHRLIEPEYMEGLRIRLVERETGKKVVTDKTRGRARIDFAKGEALFKQKRYADAHKMATSAVEGDPEKWQYQYLLFRSGFRSGAIPMADAEPGILSLQGMTTIEKADQLYTLGEMLLKDSQEDKAYKMFRQAVSLDGQNVGANRRLRLQDRRQRDEAEKSGSGGLFGGLFQRRK